MIEAIDEDSDLTTGPYRSPRIKMPVIDEDNGSKGSSKENSSNSSLSDAVKIPRGEGFAGQKGMKDVIEGAINHEHQGAIRNALKETLEAKLDEAEKGVEVSPKPVDPKGPVVKANAVKGKAVKAKPAAPKKK